MRRFEYEENDEYREEVERFFNPDDATDVSDNEYEEMLDEEGQQQATQQIQFDFVERDMNHRTLRAAIRSCEKSFWWKFCSQQTRVKMIEETYKSLRNLEDVNADL